MSNFNIKWTIPVLAMAIALQSCNLKQQNNDISEKFKPYVFYDDFSNGNKNNWNTGHNDSVSAVIENNQLVLVNRCVAATRRCYCPISIDPRKNFTIETTATKIRGDVYTSYGISWGSDDSGYYHGFIINCDGRHYSIGTMTGKKFKLIKPWTFSSSINYERENKLAIKKQEDSLSFYINDTFVDKEPFSDFFGPFIGAFVDQASPGGERKAAFNYFKVTGTLLQ